MANVRGLRIGNDDDTQTASLDRLPDGRLFVNISFQLSDVRFDMESIGRAIQKGNAILPGLVTERSREPGDCHGGSEN